MVPHTGLSGQFAREVSSYRPGCAPDRDGRVMGACLLAQRLPLEIIELEDSVALVVQAQVARTILVAFAAGIKK
jgi:hypothetical protein